MPMKKCIGNTKGFSLIELLIAMVILAIGLIGMASLMLTSMQSNQSAAQRSAAIVLSYDLVERMRSNPDQVKLYIGSIGDPGSLIDPCDTSGACDGGMNATELSGNDLLNWAIQLQRSIPGSAAIVQQIAPPNGDEYCIAIFWPQNQANIVAADATACGAPANGREFTTVQVTL